MDIEELNRKLDQNSEKINNNIKNIENNFKQIQENSIALDILKDYKKQSEHSHKDNKRLFILIIIILVMWFITIGYLVYVLNDIGTIEETTTQEVVDVDSIGGNVINKGA